MVGHQVNLCVHIDYEALRIFFDYLGCQTDCVYYLDNLLIKDQ